MPIQIAGGVEPEILELLRLRSSATSIGDTALIDSLPSEVDEIRAALSDGHVLIATDDDGIVGFAYVARKDVEGSVDFEGLFVEPEKMGRGHGSDLCRGVLDLALSQGATAVSVIADPRSDSIYRSFGFEVVEVVETQFRLAARMTKTLD